MRVVVPLLLLASAGCHIGLAGMVSGVVRADGPYEQGAIAKDLGPDAVRTLACLDIGLSIHERDYQTLLDLDVGNRCIHGEPFAFDAMTIRAEDVYGKPRSVTLSDPRHEIKPVHVGAQERGHERFSIDGLHLVDEVCFDLTGTVPDAPHTRAAPLCIVRDGREWHAKAFS